MTVKTSDSERISSCGTDCTEIVIMGLIAAIAGIPLFFFFT